MVDLSYTLGVIAGILFIKHNEYIQTYISDIWENVKEKTLNEIAMEIFWNGNYAYTLVKYRFGKLHETFPLVRSFSRSFSKVFQSTIKSSDAVYPWASITRLNKSSDNGLSVIEDTFDLSDFEWKDRSIGENLVRLKMMSRQLLDTDSVIQECLVLIAPSEDVTICRVVTRDTDISQNENMDTNKLGKLSLVKFLMIDYLHPDIEDAVELLVKKSYFIEGNQLLSAAFIGRLLPKYVSFDTTYKTVIIDNEVQLMEWSYSDFTEIVADNKYVLRTSNEKACDITQSPGLVMDDDETKSWDKVDLLR